MHALLVESMYTRAHKLTTHVPAQEKAGVPSIRLQMGALEGGNLSCDGCK